MHPIAELAKNAIETYVIEGRVIHTPDPMPAGMCEKAGVFVSIKKNSELRGCIGTYLPACTCIGDEIINNAISAATKDPRFSPVTQEELKDLTYSVDVLSCPERVNNIRELDPMKYGIIVVGGFSRGLLLPDIEGVGTVEEQIRIAKMKAGILPQEEVQIYKFKVKRYA